MTNRICSVPGCIKPHKAKGLCSKHYQRLALSGTVDDPPPRPAACTVDGCGAEPVVARAMCDMHYCRWKRRGTTAPRAPRICVVDGCSGPHEALGYCPKHYARLRTYGSIADRPRPRLTDEQRAASRARRLARSRDYYHRRGKHLVRERIEEYREYHRAYRAANREQHRAYARRWYAANRDKAQQANLRWIDDNPQAARRNWQIKQMRRRAIKRGAPAERIDPVDVYERDGWLCHLCGAPIDRALGGQNPLRVSLDHVIAVNAPDFPGHVWENLAAAHLRCNIAKGDRVSGHDRALFARLAAARGRVVLVPGQRVAPARVAGWSVVEQPVLF